MGRDRWSREEILALLERERMVSLLNDTRWMRLIEGLKGLPLRYRVKVLTEEEVWDAGVHLFLPVPDLAYIEGTLTGPVPARAIEWLEIEPVDRRYRGPHFAYEAVDSMGRVEELLESLRIPYFRRGALIRVTGHARPA